MFGVEVSTNGLEFDDLVQKLSTPLRQKLVEKLADIAWASAFWNAPRRTGYLASTIVEEVGEEEASIDALASYAVYVVNGTRPHQIRPVNASILAFEEIMNMGRSHVAEIGNANRTTVFEPMLMSIMIAQSEKMRRIQEALNTIRPVSPIFKEEKKPSIDTPKPVAVYFKKKKPGGEQTRLS